MPFDNKFTRLGFENACKPPFSTSILKVSKGIKIRNRYNQVPHLTQDTNGKVTNSQLDITNEIQEVSPFPEGDHKAHINGHTQRHSKHKTEKHKRSTKEYRLGKVSLEGLNRFNSAPTSPQAFPCKFDIKKHSPSIRYISVAPIMCWSLCFGLDL